MKIMKNLFWGVLLVFFGSYQLNAQKKDTKKQNFDHWSIDLGAGIHQLGQNLSLGYDNDPLFQGNFGVRYMFNEKFGLRADLGYNSFKEAGDSNPFQSNLYRATLEGVFNLGNVLNFQSWTKRFNLLAHVGGGVSSLNVTEPIDNGGDFMTHMSFGVTPQYKLTNRISLFLDISTFLNFHQTENFDGSSNMENTDPNLSYFNTSLGLNIALGKNKQLADSSQEKEMAVNEELEEIKKRLKSAEKEIASLKVKTDSEVNKNNLIYELDTRYTRKGEANTLDNSDSDTGEVNKYANEVTASNVSFIRELLNRGYVNVYFDTNKATIQKESLPAINYLKQFMNDNPTVVAGLIGYTDETGEEGYNLKLSKRRAKAVYDILVAAGIDPTRLTYGGVGEDKGLTNEAKQLARKVAFRIQ